SGKKMSQHAYGLAIDLNPKINPYISNGMILPASGMHYANRDQEVIGMIKKGDPVYEAFISRGWSWGGDWTSIKDYQHFEKKIN
ncbi:MAG: M15 family metallopeptidase, partial [Turicibacter sp.]